MPRSIASGLRGSLAASLSIAVGACSSPDPVTKTEPAHGGAHDTTSAAPSFVNRVWKVERSTGIQPGAFYVFLSDSTLLIASAQGTPALGRWTYAGDTLTLIEEGIAHRATVTKLTSEELSIVLAGRGDSLAITFVPVTGAEATSAMPTTPPSLVATVWKLEDVGGTKVLDDTKPTLTFPEAGKIAGHGSCNRFFGTVEITGTMLKIGPVGATRMACLNESIMQQETTYLRALEKADRYKVEGKTLWVYSASLAKPLRFTREAP